jgi:ribosomal protein L35
MIYLLTANGLTPGGSSTVHITHKKYTERPKNLRYIEQHKKQYVEQHKKYIEQQRNNTWNNTKINWESADRAPSW